MRRWREVLGAFLIIFTAAFAQECLPTLERYLGYSILEDKSNAILSRSQISRDNLIAKCYAACEAESNCGAFILVQEDESSNECILLNLSVPDDSVELIEKWLKPQGSASVFNKICLASACNASVWHFDLVPNWSLQSEKLTAKTHKVSSLRHCQDLCSQEQQFQCQSFTFDPKTSECFLSKFDRRSLPPGTGWMRPEEGKIYGENECARVFSSGCEFQRLEGSAPKYFSKSVAATDLNECEKNCEQENMFVCRAFEFSSQNANCALTSEDTYALATIEQINTVPHSGYYQRGNCLQVDMECDSHVMQAHFSMSQEFSGKFYSLAAKESCMFDIDRSFEFSINISISDLERCGVVEEGPNVYSTRLMMQYHDFVLTGMDRIYKFMCTFKIERQNVQNSVDLRDPPTKVPRVVSAGARKALPQAVMRIVNGEGEAVSSAELGQTLYAEVTLRDTAGTGEEFGIFVTECQAFVDENSSTPVQLLDESGCPLDTNVFEGFSTVPGSNNNKLRAAFRGFRFETKSRVNINCDVNICFQFCEPALCSDRNGRRIQSYGKRKKRSNNGRFFTKVHVHSEFLVSQQKRQPIDGRVPVLREDHVTTYELTPLSISLFVLCAIVIFGALAAYARRRCLTTKSYDLTVTR